MDEGPLPDDWSARCYSRGGSIHLAMSDLRPAAIRDDARPSRIGEFMKSIRLTPCAAAVAAALLQMANPAFAVNCTLTTNGLWQTPGDWSCNARPASGDAATITVGGLVTINQAEQITTLSNAGTINISAFTLSLLGGGSTTNTGTINVGGASTAALQVSNNINNAGGTINVGAGSVINQFGTTITGGTINTTGSGALVATNNGSNVLSGVTLNGLLDMATNTGFEQIGGSGLTLNGAVNINNNSVLAFNGGTQTLGGNGTLTLGNTGGSNRISIESGGILNTGANTLIHGMNGTIGGQAINGGASTLNNGGTLSADVAGGSINLIANLTNNANTLSATNGGQLVLGGNVVNTGSGHIDAIGAGSNVYQNGVAVTGGTINTGSGGTYVSSNNSVNLLSGVTLNGVLDLATNTGVERVQNGLTLASGSKVNLNANSILAFDGGTQTLAGTGAVTFGNTGGSNRLTIENTGTLTVGSGVLIHGESGSIGGQAITGGAATLINNGTISADVAGGTITILTNNGATNAVQNNGVLSAANGGSLVLSSNVTGNAGSSINVGTGSTVVQNGVIISGVINNSGTGNFVATNNGANVFNNVTFTGALNLATNTGSETVRGNLTLNGGVNINNNSVFVFEGGGAQIVNGTGTITLGNTGGSNRVAVDNTGTLTIGSGILIHGENGTVGGQVYVGGPSTIINNGTISADVSGGSINLITNNGAASAFTNNGTLSAQNGGTLVLSTNVTGGSGGAIVAGAGSTVVQNGVTLSGAINTSGNGNFIATNNGANYLNGVTLNGVLDIATNTGSEQVVNGLTLNGGININNNSALVFQGGTQTLTGNGTLTLGNTGGSNRIAIDNTGTLNVASGITIHGQNGTIGGQVNVGGSSTLNNAGLITADVAGGSINLAANTTNNSNVLSATNGGQLVLSGTLNNVGSGHVDAVGAGSNVLQNGITITGGILNSSGGGVIVATNSGANTLSGVTVAGVLDIATNTGVEQITNGVTVNGDVRINNNSTFVFAGGTQTLGGTGTITLGNTGGSNRIGVDNTGTLNIASGVTIHGQNGTIGGQVFVGGASTINNAGTIRADVAGGTIDLSPSVLTNSGTLAATAGTLNVNLGFTGTGTVLTSGTGVVRLAGPASVGNLVNNGTSANALTIGTNNVTVSADYTNASFGTGNAFNKRANVTGTGQILASGNVAQAITGANVTNGTTGTPTLTIGNVRVGGTTYNYQVANSGTTGPAIRGALQTNVNGGNITDSRLSGSGVTASNYGPVAAGANSGNLGVTFTVASAGALAPLAGQSVHVANNFDNLSEQTLNIVLGSGAAAFNAAVGSTTPSPVTVANQRVGGTNSSALTVANTAAAGNFSEALNASFGATSGAATSNGGSFTNLAAGSSNNGALAVGVNTTTAGAKTGSVTIAYQTDGTGSNGHSGLSAISAGSQSVAVSGNVYQTAAGNIVTAPFNFGTVQVGQVVSQNVTVQNTATGASGFVEDLNASFGAASGTGANRLTGTGSVNGLVAGSSSNALAVGVNTSSAGTVNASIAVNYFSAGTVGGVSNGLGTLAVGSQGYGVTGTINSTANVVDQANPQINNAPIALGNVRIGSTSPTGTVSVTNVASGNQQAALNASISGNAPVTASGSFNLLNPGATNNSSLTVGINTATAGNKSGTATVSFVSDASNIGNCAPNCQMTLASQNVAVTGAVYRLANPAATPSTVTVAGRVGSASPTTALTITNASSDIYTEGLTVTRGATSSGFTSSGSITNLAAGGSSGAIGVMLNTATAGTFSGTQALAYTSTGAGTTGAADVSVGSGNVTLNGKVYTPAVASLNTSSVAFGIVHVGDAVAQQNVSVTNSAAVTALNDTLVASASGATGPFSATGNLGAGLGAQQTSASALKVGLNTTTAGVYNGSATFSAASHDADLSDAALASLGVSLSGQVNNYATDAFSFGSGAGAFSQSGSTYILDYGTVAQNSGTRSTTLLAGNSASGPADALDGTFQFLDPADFGEGGFSSFLNLMAGQTTGPLMLSFASSSIGVFMDTITLHGVGHNASGYSAAIGDITLMIRGTVTGQVVPPVTGVPEPDSLLLLGLGLPLLFIRRGRKASVAAGGSALH